MSTIERLSFCEWNVLPASSYTRHLSLKSLNVNCRPNVQEANATVTLFFGLIINSVDDSSRSSRSSISCMLSEGGGVSRAANLARLAGLSSAWLASLASSRRTSFELGLGSRASPSFEWSFAGPSSSSILIPSFSRFGVLSGSKSSFTTNGFRGAATSCRNLGC